MIQNILDRVAMSLAQVERPLKSSPIIGPYQTWAQLDLGPRRRKFEKTTGQTLHIIAYKYQPAHVRKVINARDRNLDTDTILVRIRVSHLFFLSLTSRKVLT